MISIYCYGEITTYFSELYELWNNKDIFTIVLEIILTIFYMFCYFMNLICELLVIKYLNPNYILMSENLYYEYIKLKEYYEERINNPDLHNFWILQTAQIIEFIGCCIYLEIIELRFCGLNKNVKSNIIRRSIKDFMNKTDSNIESESSYLNSFENSNNSINSENNSIFQEIENIFK